MTQLKDETLPPPSAPQDSIQVNVDLATVKNAATMIAKKYPFSECYQIVLYLMRIGKEADEQLELKLLETQKAQAVEEYQRAQENANVEARKVVGRLVFPDKDEDLEAAAEETKAQEP